METLEKLTCVMVWNTAPETLCWFFKLNLATNKVPDANTKSAPMTERIEAGKPKAQYASLGLMKANRREEQAVRHVPKATAIVNRG